MNLNALLKVLAKYGSPKHVQVVYEAGPAGFGLYRALRARGYCHPTEHWRLS